MDKKGVVGICGSGLIGRGWAVLFSRSGFQVNLFDLKKEQIAAALEDIERQLNHLKDSGMLEGGRSVEDHMKLIKGVNTLEECVKDAIHVQECIPEGLQLKKEIFSKLDKVASPTTVLASSTSTVAPSHFTADLKNRANCLVNHPISPPTIIRLIEIVPAPWTSPDAVRKTKALMEQLGQKPVTFMKELLGFGVNRIQLAILNECWHLVKEGYLSVPDVDLLMSEGLGMRYAFQGPFETCHLLADGIASSIKHFGPSFIMMGKTFLPQPSWDLEDGKPIIDQMNEKLPLDQVEVRRKWRDEKLVELAKIKLEKKQ